MSGTAAECRGGVFVCVFFGCLISVLEVGWSVVGLLYGRSWHEMSSLKTRELRRG